MHTPMTPKKKSGNDNAAVLHSRNMPLKDSKILCPAQVETEGNFKDHLVPPTCHGQEHFPLDYVA